MLCLFGCDSESELWNDLIAGESSQREISRRLQEKGLADFAVLSTCHRLECYWNSEEANPVKFVKELLISNLFNYVSPKPGQYYLKIGPAVIDHLFRVSAGLDSLIVGEHEILGQIRDCLKEAGELKTIGPIIGTLLREAVSIGKKVRSQTAIGKGKTSYASLILEMIDKTSWLNPLDLDKVLILGTGKLARAVGLVLAKQGIQPFFVAGRNLEKATVLAKSCKGECMLPERLPSILKQFKLVIGASKANRILVTESDLASVNHQQLIIDLSVPGVVSKEVENFPEIEYIGLQIVECLIEDNIQQRLTEIDEAEVLVAKAVEEMTVSIRQRQRQEQIEIAREKLYIEGQTALERLLARVNDDVLKREIAKQWDEQLKKLVYLALSIEKNDKLRPGVSAQSSYFPIILSLENRRILVVGGGKVALRKINKMLEAKAEITVTAPQIEPELAELAVNGRIKWRQESFKSEQLIGYDLIIAATNEREVNSNVVESARRERILVNSVDEAVYSDFLFPAIIRRGDLLIAVSTSGKSPALARKIRQELEFIFGREYEEILSN